MMNDLYFLQLNDKVNIYEFNKLTNLTSYKYYKFNKINNLLILKVSLEIILRYVVVNKYDINNDNLNISYNKYKRPYLNIENIYYSNSYGENCAIIFISNNNIGVDIEKLKLPNINLAKKFFTNKEFNYVFESYNLQKQRFFEIWTKKEAYIKYIGTGFYTKINSFDVINSKYSKLFNSFILNNHMVSICMNSKKFFNVHKVCFEDIIKLSLSI